jgi:Fe-S oxidoreductase
VAQNTAKILLKAGVDLGMLGKNEICCGSPVARIGDRETFMSLAKRNIELLNESGVKEIVSFCPGCFRAMTHDYKEIPGAPALKARVYHTAEYIDKLIQDGKLTITGELKMRVTWHDPCHLGRHLGIYDAPRRILQAIPGVELVEMERIKDQSWCCGGGGGARTAFMDFAQKTATKRLQEAKKTGAQSIITSCPFCEQNLGDAVSKMDDGLAVQDLTDLLIRVLDIE